MFMENEYTELKVKLTKDIKKEIVALANTRGGTIYIGVDDKGNVIGLSNVQDDVEALSSMIRDGIKSDLTLYTNIGIEDINGKKIIVLKVMSGPNKPYYLSDKGLKPSGVYIRHGSVSTPTTDETIKKIIVENHDSFEEKISINQKLHFSYLTNVFNEKNIEINRSKYKLLGLFDCNEQYTNLALLLSDECPFTIKCAIFNGNNKIEFKDRKEFTGSLLKQLEDTLDFLNIANRISGRIVNYKRVDIRDYPEYALRESVLNAIIHRNYNFTGSILISVFDNRIEVSSLGGLMAGITLDDIMNGVSQARNKNLSNIFYRLEYVESYGTGIGRMLDVYKEFDTKPDFVITDNLFKVILPNINYVENNETNVVDVMTQKEKIIRYLKNNQIVKRDTVDLLLDVSSTRSKAILSEMVSDGMIEKKGQGRNTYYVIK